MSSGMSYLIEILANVSGAEGVKSLDDSLQRTGKSAESAGTSIGTAGEKVEGFGNKADGASGKTSNFGEKLDAVAGKAKWVAAGLAAVGGLAVKEMVESDTVERGLQSAAESHGMASEKSMASLYALADNIKESIKISDDQVKAWERQAIQLGVTGDKMESVIKGTVGLRAAGMDETAALKASIAVSQGRVDLLKRYVPELANLDAESKQSSKSTADLTAAIISTARSYTGLTQGTTAQNKALEAQAASLGASKSQMREVSAVAALLQDKLKMPARDSIKTAIGITSGDKKTIEDVSTALTSLATDEQAMKIVTDLMSNGFKQAQAEADSLGGELRALKENLGDALKGGVEPWEDKLRTLVHYVNEAITTFVEAPAPVRATVAALGALVAIAAAGSVALNQLRKAIIALEFFGIVRGAGAAATALKGVDAAAAVPALRSLMPILSRLAVPAAALATFAALAKAGYDLSSMWSDTFIPAGGQTREELDKIAAAAKSAAAELDGVTKSLQEQADNADSAISRNEAYAAVLQKIDEIRASGAGLRAKADMGDVDAGAALKAAVTQVQELLKIKTQLESDMSAANTGNIATPQAITTIGSGGLSLGDYATRDAAQASQSNSQGYQPVDVQQFQNGAAQPMTQPSGADAQQQREDAIREQMEASRGQNNDVADAAQTLKDATEGSSDSGKEVAQTLKDIADIISSNGSDTLAAVQILAETVSQQRADLAAMRTTVASLAARTTRLANAA